MAAKNRHPTRDAIWRALMVSLFAVIGAGVFGYVVGVLSANALIQAMRSLTRGGF